MNSKDKEIQDTHLSGFKIDVLLCKKFIGVKYTLNHPYQLKHEISHDVHGLH